MAKDHEYGAYIGSLIHQSIRCTGLELQNQRQAGRMMELELLLSCIHRVGQTVYFDAQTAQRLMLLYPDTQQFIRNKNVRSKHEEGQRSSLSSSKYLKG